MRAPSTVMIGRTSVARPGEKITYGRRIAVPTSTGYGATFGGVSALHAMLASCAAGVAVVNIDDGFSAGTIAARIARRAAGEERI